MATLTALSVGQLPIDESWFRHVNDFARATGWLHGPLVAYAQYGVALFAALLLAAWWSRGASAARTSGSWTDPHPAPGAGDRRRGHRHRTGRATGGPVMSQR